MKPPCDLEALFHDVESGLHGVVDETTLDGNHYVTVLDVNTLALKAHVTIENKHRFHFLHPALNLTIHTCSGQVLNHKVDLGWVPPRSILSRKQVECILPIQNCKISRIKVNHRE